MSKRKFGGTTGDLDFYKEVPTFRFDTPKGKGTYKIISVFKTNTLTAHGDFFNYMISDFENDKLIVLVYINRTIKE